MLPSKLFETLGEITLRVAIVYGAVLLGIRVTGKREVGQMAPFDLVLLMLLANAVQNAMTGPDTSVAGGIVAAMVLLLMNRMVGVFAWRFPSFRRLVEGSPTVLIHHGEIVRKNLSHERISEEELQQALREHGIETAADVHSAVLEVDGTISVLRNDDIRQPMKPYKRIRIIRKTSGGS